MAKKTTTKTKTDNKAATEGKAVTKRSQAVRKAIGDASKSIETNHLNLAKLLHEAFTKEYASQWGFEDFEAFCAAEVGVGYRKARYMVDIWAKVSERKIPAAALSKIGWSKLKEICSVMGDAFNVSDEDLIKMANDMSLRELTTQIKEMRAGKTGRNPSTFKVTVQVGESANKVIMEALEEAKKIMEKDDTGLALEMICQDWLMEKGKVPERTDIKDFVAYLEDMYGVTITVKAKKGATNKAAEAQKEAAAAGKATGGKGKGKGKAKGAAEESKGAAKGKGKAKPKTKAKTKPDATTQEQDDELDALLGGDDEGDGDLDAILGGDDEGGGDDLGLEDESGDLGTDDQEIDDLLGLGD